MNDYPSVDKVGGLNKKSTVEVTRKNLETITNAVENFKPDLDTEVTEVNQLDVSSVDIDAEVSSVMDRKTFSVTDDIPIDSRDVPPYDQRHVHGYLYGFNELSNIYNESVLAEFKKQYVDNDTGFSDMIEPLQSQKFYYEKYECPNNPFSANDTDIDFGIEKNVLSVKNFMEYTLPYKDSRTFYELNVNPKIVIPMLPIEHKFTEAPFENGDNVAYVYNTFICQTDDNIFGTALFLSSYHVDTYRCPVFSDLIYIRITGAEAAITMSITVDQSEFTFDIKIDDTRHIDISINGSIDTFVPVILPVIIDQYAMKFKVGICVEYLNLSENMFQTLVAEVTKTENCEWYKYEKPNLSFYALQSCSFTGSERLKYLRRLLIGDTSLLNIADVQYENMSSIKNLDEFVTILLKSLRNEDMSFNTSIYYTGPIEIVEDVR